MHSPLPLPINARDIGRISSMKRPSGGTRHNETGIPQALALNQMLCAEAG
jgi:hypothetical protein